MPRQILDYASTLLAVIAPELTPPSLRADPGALDLVPVPVPAAALDAAALDAAALDAAALDAAALDAAALDRALVTACRQACARPGSVAVIAADPQVPALGRALAEAGLEYGPPGADSALTLVPVTLAKGLEYDPCHRGRARPHCRRRG